MAFAIILNHPSYLRLDPRTISYAFKSGLSLLMGVGVFWILFILEDRLTQN